MNKILITGGSGLIGHRLTHLLLIKEYEVNILTRHQHHHHHAHHVTHEGLKSFVWDIKKGEIDGKAFEGVSAIVHLAGANIAGKKWTHEQKREIIESRVKSASLIYDYLNNHEHEVNVFISASGIDYYGDCGSELIKEHTPAGKGFLADVCRQWEDAAIRFKELGIREVRCRTGIVLAAHGGALPELIKTVPLGFAGYFAKTPLYYPWIHRDDVCGIYMHAIENAGVTGAYNTTAPTPLPMKELMQEILRARKSKAKLIPAPPFLLKLALGERSNLLLGSHNSSCEKIVNSGYQFKFGEIGKALEEIFKKL